MKIGIYDPYLDDLGGGEKYMMTIASCLSQKHDVTVFWNNEEDFYAVRDRFNLNLEKVTLSENIFTPQTGFFKRLFATKKIDVLIILSDGSIPVSLSKKLLIHIQQPLSQLQTNSLKNQLKLSRVDSFFCNSLYTKDFIDQKFHIKTAILYPPVDIYSEKVEKENSILHVGRFRVKNVAVGDYKKQGFMVETFKKMITNGLKNWKLVIATSFPKEAEKDFQLLKDAAKGFPIEFFINKSNKELWSLYNKSKIYWHASGYGEDLEKNPEYAEHFGISTVEAMGAGCIPVVINAGGQKEIVTDAKNGLLWNTREELIEKTKQVISNPGLRNTLEKNARLRAKDFSLEKFSEGIMALVG
ncbi:MAG TPA: glycosyltransferase family 4 protein [Candidatus Saccharimonadales bacterium]|nr:glycosyltransferase family 4 protein [Candidatus Saccharimonadales bacterium]